VNDLKKPIRFIFFSGFRKKCVSELIEKEKSVAQCQLRHNLLPKVIISRFQETSLRHLKSLCLVLDVIGQIFKPAKGLTFDKSIVIAL